MMLPDVLTFVGDVYLPRAFDIDVVFNGGLVINLECPLTRSTEPVDGKVVLKGDPDALCRTFPKLPVAACLANNHMFDYGEEGFKNTTDQLDGLAIQYFGITEAGGRRRSARVETGYGPVHLLGYTDVYSPAFARAGQVGTTALCAQAVEEDIATARADGAVRVVVSYHWGAENVYFPKGRDVAIARSTVDLGADLVIGHHAHRVQAREVYNGRAIFYGLGNCIFDDLDLSAFFTGAGSTGMRYKKRQHAWNRKSLAVEYDPRANSVVVRRLRFRGNRLREDRSRFWHGSHDHLGDARWLEARYRASYLFGKGRKKLLDIIAEPRMPRLGEIGRKVQLWRRNLWQH